MFEYSFSRQDFSLASGSREIFDMKQFLRKQKVHVSTWHHELFLVRREHIISSIQH